MRILRASRTARRLTSAVVLVLGTIAAASPATAQQRPMTLDDVLTTQGEEGVAEQYESSPATPGGEGVLSVDLVAGRWVLLCPIPGPTGTPHFADGMLREFTL